MNSDSLVSTPSKVDTKSQAIFYLQLQPPHSQAVPHLEHSSAELHDVVMQAPRAKSDIQISFFISFLLN